MKTLNFFGSGPRIGKIVLPYLAGTIVLTLLFPSIFTFPVVVKSMLLYIGIPMFVVGLGLYAVTARALLKAIKERRMVTSGLFKYSQNPLYAMIMLMIFPGVGLIMNSWLILTTTVVGYLAFRLFIRQEYDDMTEVFGDSYTQYKSRTPEFFPFFK